MQPIIRFKLLKSSGPSSYRVDVACFHDGQWLTTGMLVMSRLEWNLFKQTLSSETTLFVTEGGEPG